MRFDSLQGWLQWQQSCHPSEIDLGLQRIGQVASTMSLTLDQCQVVTVAGTNGKGSCVAALNALLLSAGKQVGCFTSPHFVHYNERIQINSQPVSDQQLLEAFDRIDQARGDTSLSYFEFGTLAALDIFQRSELDVVLLEVGLGGRLDAVNIIDADVAVVTSVDIDHQEWLGSDREQIGIEKAGIFRAGRPAISAGLNPPQSIKQRADQLGAKLLQAGEHFSSEISGRSGRWCWRGQSATGQAVVIEDLPPLLLPPESVAAAIQAAQLLVLSAANIHYDCLAVATLPGRFQCITIAGKQLVLDVAHNPAAANYLAQRLLQQPCNGRSIALFAAMADKDVEGIIMPLISCFDSWYVVQLDAVARAMPARQIADTISKLGADSVRVGGNVADVLPDLLTEMTAEDRLVVFGSFYTVAEVLGIYHLEI